MAKIKFDSNIEDYKKQMAKAGLSIQDAGIEAVNMAAYSMYRAYRQLLIKNTALKSRDYTLGAVKVFQAKQLPGGRKWHQLKDVNSKMVVPMMKGEKEHYLHQLETGAKRQADQKLGGVPIPLDMARAGGQRSGKVAPLFRLDKQYAYGGALDLSMYAGDRSRQGSILNDMARRGRLAKNTYYAANLGDGRYMVRVTKGKAFILRNLSEQQTSTPAEPLFEESTKTITTADMDYYFLKAMQKKLAELS